MPYLHHIFLHFPVALGLAATIPAFLAIIRPDSDARRHAAALLVLAALFAVPTAITGLLSTEHAGAVLVAHRNAALLALFLYIPAGLWAALLLWGKQGRAASPTALFLIALLPALAVGYAAHLGGKMVHPGLSLRSKQKPHTHGPADGESGEAGEHHEEGEGSGHHDEEEGAAAGHHDDDDEVGGEAPPEKEHESGDRLRKTHDRTDGHEQDDHDHQH